MKNIFRFIILIYSLTAGLAFSLDNDSVVPAEPVQKSNPIEKILFQKASHLFDEEDYGKALILYNQLITEHPNSPLKPEAYRQIESIINDLMPEISPEAKYNKLNDNFSVKKKFSLYENAVFLLNSYPSKKYFNIILKFIDQCLWEPSIRFNTSFVGEENTALIYQGSAVKNGVRIHNFSYGRKKITAKLGDTVLFYKLIGYDDILEQVKLIPLDDLPYKLLEKNDRQSLRYLEAKITHIHLEYSLTAHIFVDELITDRGLHFSGLSRYGKDKNLILDFPFINIKRITLSESKIEFLKEAAVRKKPCAFDKKFSSSLYSDPLAVSRARIQYYINTKHWFEATGLYFLLLTKDKIPQGSTLFSEIYDVLKKKHMSSTLSERLMEKALYFMSHDYFFSGYKQLYSLAKKYPSEPVGLEARVQLIKNAHKPNGIFVVESIKSIPFPLTFMGYNKVNYSDEQYQLNYAGRSHFVGQNQELAGYKMIKSEEKVSEIFNPTLNINEKINLKYLIVEPAKTNMVFLKKGGSLSNKEKVYLEIEDRRTGKIYPGYIILDYLKTIKNIEYYGIIADTKKKHELKVFRSFTNLNSPVSIKDFNTAILNRVSRFEPMTISRISSIIGKVLFSKLKNYFAIKPLKTSVSVSGVESDEKKAFVTETNVSEKQVIREQAVKPELLQKIEEKIIDIPADADKNKAQSGKKLMIVNRHSSNLFKQNIEDNKPNPDQLSRIEKRIKIKKIIIKLLALQLVVWLIFIGYKLFKNWKV